MSDVDTLSGSLGATLRDLRVARGVSREDMARATRIGLSYVDALEADRIGELPAPVFVKGFIRAYCAQLGEPPEPHLRRLRLLLGEPADAAPPPPGPRARGPRLGPLAASAVLVAAVGAGLFAVTLLGRAYRPSVEPVTMAPPRPAAPGGAREPAAAGTAGAPAPPGTGAAPSITPAPAVPSPASPGAAAPSRPAPAPPTATRAPAPSPPAQRPAPAPSGPADSRDASAPRRVTPGPLRLTVRAVEETWVRVQTDEGRVVSELLEPGAVREWSSDRQFVLTVGNAAGIELTLNGRPMPPLGGRGVVRRLEIPGPAAAEAAPRP